MFRSLTLLAAFAVACGGETTTPVEGEGTPTEEPVAATRTAHEKLQGSWNIDAASLPLEAQLVIGMTTPGKTRADLQPIVDQMTPEETKTQMNTVLTMWEANPADPMLSMMTSAAGDARAMLEAPFVFTADMVTPPALPGAPGAEPYVVISQTETSITIGENATSTDTMTCTFETDDKMSCASPGQPAMVMVRRP